mmetsp:Transcript_40864/g.102916  ORF Transcript_40864/g.102916 Transcript_40864/m.102916 type:complete len:330 (-) Transcript_40864:183-1172(-)|eukprot:CAMPEP_0177643850 /NCGR_PEP_ID=MMETSP0447-20121125/8369_1 /TAXON_ID=0 /ORGANISM="Stygamoeba regulata, Strain BSH-02190019" /LENGTH=329 /DNA_ID=CAMNT_0019146161 /DNA_START=140 /DNA_END=1129 /DNA_ORIENTATION=-
MEWLVLAGVLTGAAVAFAIYRHRTQQAAEEAENASPWGSLVIDTSNDALMIDVTEKWEKRVEDLPVSVDLPRLARKMVIYDSSNTVILDGGWLDLPPEELARVQCAVPTPTTRFQLVRAILLLLARELEPSSEGVIAEKFHSLHLEEPHFGGDISGFLGVFLRTHLGNDSHIVRVLKVCNQSVIAPAVLRLKKTIASKYPFKDVRGAWRIHLHIRSRDEVVVRHMKREMSWEAGFTILSTAAMPMDGPGSGGSGTAQQQQQEDFQFGWCLEVVLGRELAFLSSVRLWIDSFSFSKTLPGWKRADVLKVAAPYHPPSVNPGLVVRSQHFV